ncbi:MAG: shikimate kinase [Candidatus Paceibacterota bacterium]
MRDTNIFFVGPASVGKSTTGKLLAKRLNFKFVDVDKEFCKRIALIPDFVKLHGYTEYCETNSILVDELLNEHPTSTIFATPSGFLVHEQSPHLVKKHLELISRFISVLLLPGKDPQEYVDLIVQRQLNRWTDCDEENERNRFLSRFEKYKRYGDIKVYSVEKSEVIVSKIIKQLQTRKKQPRRG